MALADPVVVVVVAAVEVLAVPSIAQETPRMRVEANGVVVVAGVKGEAKVVAPAVPVVRWSPLRCSAAM
jgi:hypothetical protein